MMISNIGVLYDWPAAYTPNSGPMDAFINVQLTEQRRHTAQDYAHRLRQKLRDEFPCIEFAFDTCQTHKETKPYEKDEFPCIEFAFDTGGLITAALNFGLPSPINIQVEGNKLDVAYTIARRIKEAVEHVSGTVDVRIQQKPDYPQIQIAVDRVKAAYLGLTQEEVVKNIVTTLNSSINFASALDPSTRTMKVEVDFPNPDGLLRPGMYGNLTLALETTAEALTLPATALLTEQDKTFVYVVEDGKARKVEVTTGIDDGIRVEIVKGLQGNAEIVVAGASAITDGGRVRAVHADALATNSQAVSH